MGWSHPCSRRRHTLLGNPHLLRRRCKLLVGKFHREGTLNLLVAASIAASISRQRQIAVHRHELFDEVGETSVDIVGVDSDDVVRRVSRHILVHDCKDLNTRCLVRLHNVTGAKASALLTWIYFSKIEAEELRRLLTRVEVKLESVSALVLRVGQDSEGFKDNDNT